jgi:predicted enzyme related to lactoylglutathione lyase
MHRVVHFEIPAEDPQRCNKFYQDVFGWRMERFGDMEYWSCFTGDKAAPGIDGGIIRRKDPAQPVTCTIQVEDVDAACEKLTAHGGTVVVPKMPIPTVGWLAYFKDTEGNIFGVYKHDPSAS